MCARCYRRGSGNGFQPWSLLTRAACRDLWTLVLGELASWRDSLTIILCSSAFGAILQGSLFGLAGILPASYTTPIMSGQGLAGAFAAFSMICALASRCQLQGVPQV